MDQLVRQPESEALRIHFDGRNGRVLFRLQLFYAVTALLTAVVFLIRTDYLRLVAPVAGLLAVRLLFNLRNRTTFHQHSRAILVAALVLQPLLVVALTFEAGGAALRWFDVPLLLLPLAFLLPASQLLIPVSTLWTLTAGRHVLAVLRQQTPLDTPLFATATAVAAAVAVLGGLWYRYQRVSFLEEWRRENRRYREREHLQREIDEARRIQLSMLPTSDPRVPWLDVAGISIPASEVGGDYYDYFTLNDDLQAVVVADVAGHGLASGLLLTGIRSCLHLLHEEPVAPSEVLGKLDRMLRRTTARRTFVTLLYAVFDRRKRSVTFATAGHPPLLWYRADGGRVEEHGHQAPPLGTRLPATPWQQTTLDLAPGDCVVAVTDGISETADGTERGYGDSRLQQRLQDTGSDRTARAIRDALLLDLWNFKGDAEQKDDVTVVVARLP